MVKREFNAGSKFGKSILLNQTMDNSYSLVLSLDANEFFVAERLDKEKGIWMSGHYFGTNLSEAVKFFDIRNKDLIISDDEFVGRMSKKYKEMKEKER